MRPTLCLLAALTWVACHKEPAAPPPPASPEATFWSWFEKNQARLWDLPSAHGPEAVSAELRSALLAYHAGLDFDLGAARVAQKDPRDLILTAHGKPELFEAVDRLAKASPKMPRWRVTALYPRRGGDRIIAVGDQRLTVRDFSFASRPSDGGARRDVTIFLPALASGNQAAVADAALLLVTDLLGERDLATRVGKLDYAPTGDPGAPRAPLSELPAALDGSAAKAPTPP